MKRLRFDLEKAGPLIALAVLFVASATLSDHFLKPQNLLNILRQVSYSGILALGMTFVIIAGGIDLSVGSMVGLIGGVAILALNAVGGGAVGIAAAVGTAIGAGLVAGVLNGLLIVKGRVAPFIATLGTMAIYRSLSLYMAGAGEFRSQSEPFGEFGMAVVAGVPLPVWILLVLAGVLTIVLNQTPFGRYVCAVGSNERVARYAAIPVDRIRLFTYLILGILAGVSAVLLAARLNSVSSSNTGINYELDAIAAAIIGGTSLAGGRGTIAGTLIGVVILGIVNNMLNMLAISPYLQGTVKGLVIIGAVLIQRRRT